MQWVRPMSNGAAAVTNSSAAATGGAAACEGEPYRPFALSGQALEEDWVRQLDLEGARNFCPNGNTTPPK
jgi:hypothetical protein